MSEVLRRLALRALGQADEIRPRAPSLYEGGGGWLEAGADGQPPDEPSAAAPPAVMPVAPAIAAVPAVFAPPPIVAAPTLPPIQRKATAPGERIAADMPAAPAIAPVRVPAASAPTPPPEPAERASPRAFASPPPLLPERALAPAPYEPPRLDPSARPAVAAGAPDIHVSIGRVEVRADPPEVRQPPRAAPRPSPFMSLEDYLGGPRGRRR